MISCRVMWWFEGQTAGKANPFYKCKFLLIAVYGKIKESKMQSVSSNTMIMNFRRKSHNEIQI